MVISVFCSSLCESASSTDLKTRSFGGILLIYDGIHSPLESGSPLSINALCGTNTMISSRSVHSRISAGRGSISVPVIPSLNGQNLIRTSVAVKSATTQARDLMMMCPLPSVRFFNRLTFRQDVAVQKDLASHTTQGRYDPKIYETSMGAVSGTST